MWSKILTLCAASAVLLIITGCTDAAEPDTLGYVVAIGIDKPKEASKGYDITLQFANASKIGGSGDSQGGGSGGSESIENITVTAPSIYSAVNIANHIISKTFVLSHTKLIVFSKELCREGIAEFLETIGRSRDIRPSTYLAMSECRAQDFLEKVNPETEVNPVRYYTMIFENDYSGFIPQDMCSDFYFYYNSPEKNAVMPVCSVSGEKGTLNYSSTGYQQDMPDFKAGEIPSEKAETQVMGMAVFNGDTEIYEFGDIQTEIYNMLVGEYKKSYVAYYYSKLPDNAVTVRQEQKKRPKIKVDTSSDIPRISVALSLEAEFSSSVPQEAIEDNLDDFAAEAAQEIKAEAEQFLQKTCQEGTDIIGYGSYAKQNFRDTKSFASYKWKEKYKNAQFDISVDFAVRRTGLIVRSERK